MIDEGEVDARKSYRIKRKSGLIVKIGDKLALLEGSCIEDDLDPDSYDNVRAGDTVLVQEPTTWTDDKPFEAEVVGLSCYVVRGE